VTRNPSTAIAPPPDVPLRRPSPRVVETHGGPGGVDRQCLAELWRFREVLGAFALRYVKIRYKQAAVGLGWAFVQPVAAAGIFAIFLGHLGKLGSENVPYLLFALAGMSVWTYFSNAATAGSESLVYHEGLLRKVYFPREILPLAAVSSALVDLLPALLTLWIVAALYGVYPNVEWLALPLPLVLLVVAAAAFSLALSAINVYYRDVRYALPFVLQLGLFATPVVYSLDSVPGRWRDVYAILNPVAAVIDSLRRIVLHSAWPQFGVLGAAFVWTIALAFAAYVLFKRLERGFADHV
jgi:lipopolysaccharide transport system permease protein